nr:MAG TPA: hypothetical protein [Caudoviricetes sp.]
MPAPNDLTVKTENRLALLFCTRGDSRMARAP